MTTYKTSNPIGSTAVKDLYDNAENLDVLVNSSTKNSITDRLGREILTWRGIAAAGAGDTSIAVDAAARAVDAAGRAENAEAIVDATNIKGLVNEAKAARDAAFVNADVYPDITTGRASVADGEQFQVVEGDEIVRYRRNSASSQTEVARYPSSELSNQIIKKLSQLGGDSSNVYIDASVSDISLYEGDSAYVSPTSGVGVVSENLVRTGISVDLVDILTPYSPIEGGRAYFLSLRAGRQYWAIDENPDIEVYATWNDKPLGGGADIREDLIGSSDSSNWVLFETQVEAPIDARSVRFKVSKINNANVGIGAGSFIIRRAADNPKMISESLTPMNVLTRFVDTPTYLTNSIASGLPSLRPVFTDYATYQAGGGWTAQILSNEGVAARRELFYVDSIGGQDVQSFDIKCNWSNRGTTVGRIFKVEIGVAWYAGSSKAFVNEDVVVLSESSVLGITGGPFSEKFTVGTAGSGAQLTPPAGAHYFSPFIRWEQDGPGLLLADLQVAPRLNADAPEVDLNEVDRSIYAKANLAGLWRTQPPRLTSAQAAALSPFERWRSEWFVVDGGLVHQSELPSFVAQPLSVDQDFQTGDFGTASLINEGNELVIRARSWAGVAGHFNVRLKGCLGKTPVVRLTNTEDWVAPRTLTRWRLCWGTELDSDVWQPFDNIAYDDVNNEWVASNNTPFGSDTVYITRMPLFSFSRYDKKLRDWLSSDLVAPTPSAIDGFRIGTIPARVSTNGKTVPAAEALAFTIGTGPKKFIITTGMHPDEMPGHYTAEGMIDALLSSEMKSLRDEFTFFVYTRINAQGLYAGYYRRDTQSGNDMNRIWDDGVTTSDVTSLYLAAMSIDIGSEFSGFFDIHSTPGTDPSSGNGAQRSIWRKTGEPAETVTQPFLDALREYGPMRIQPSSGGNSLTNYFRQYGTGRLICAVEYLHGADHGVKEWREWGADVLRALDSVTDLFH